MTIKVIEPTHAEISYSTVSKITVDLDEISKGTINISFPEAEMNLSKQNITIGVHDKKGKLIDSYETYLKDRLDCRSLKRFIKINCWK